MQLQAKIADLARQQSFSEDAITHIKLAVSEVVTNAVVHGNKGDFSKPVHVEFHISDEEVRIRVADQGEGFDADGLPDPKAPERLTEPGGRGLLLIRELMDGVRFDPPGNRVEFWLCKHPEEQDE